jgi:hypothetical protein
MRMDGPEVQCRASEDASLELDVLIEASDPTDYWNHTTEDLYERISARNDKLFFIKYTTAQTFRPR